MGRLSHLRTGRDHILRYRGVIGRGELVVLHLEDMLASSQHASIYYEDGSWLIADVGSRNGTWVDGERLAQGKARRLERGARISFGSQDDVWELVDAGPPGPLAENVVDGSITTDRGGLLVLPDASAPEAVVYRGHGGAWKVDIDGGSRHVESGERLVLGSNVWRLWLPGGPAPTEVASGVDRWSLRFRVSADEEYVEWQVANGDKRRDMRPRSHSFVLLTLARIRLADAQAPAAEQGWVYVDELCRMLRLDRKTLNVHTYRARLQIAEEGFGQAAELIERRTPTDQIRLGVSHLIVEPMQ